MEGKVFNFIFSLTFLIVGFIYGMLQPKIYKTDITLRNTPEILFLKYNLYLQKNFEKIFDEELKLNLLSFDNLIEFLEKNNKINKLKSTLKKIILILRNILKKYLVWCKKNTLNALKKLFKERIF